jgi:hypothetical protein
MIEYQWSARKQLNRRRLRIGVHRARHARGVS